VTQRALSKSPSAIARDAEHFEFTEKQPSVLMLDHDPRRGEARSAMELDAILCEALPELRPVARAWVPSSSAFIYALDGREVIGPGSWRLYVTVDDASRIPAIGAMIYQALWGSGHGYMTVTKVHHRCQRVGNLSAWTLRLRQSWLTGSNGARQLRLLFRALLCFSRLAWSGN